MVTWSHLAEDDPTLARLVQERFDANPHHVIATVRGDGSPRLSGTEVQIDDEVRIGVMPKALRLADIRRDPRVEIHSSPVDRTLGQGDAKLSGSLKPSGDHEFTLEIGRVSLVRVTDHQLVFSVWSGGRSWEMRRK